VASVSRITDLDKHTILKALVLAGERCEKLTARLIVRRQLFFPVSDN